MLARGSRSRSKTVPAPEEPHAQSQNARNARLGDRDPRSQFHGGTVNSVNTQESSQPIHRGYALHDSLVYAYASTFHSRDRNFSITIRSPGARQEHTGPYHAQQVPIFGLRDTIGGSVDLRVPPGVGTLVITMEGTLHYSSPSFSRKFQTQVANPLRHKHVFLSSSFVFLPGSSEYSTTNTSVTGHSYGSQQQKQNSSGGIGGAIKRALSGRKRKVSFAKVPEQHQAGYQMPTTQHIVRSFSFQIPARVNQEIPPSFYASVLSEGDGIRERASVESAEVEYKVTAVWESTTGRRNVVEAPFLFLPDPSYAAPRRPLQWSETPLIATRPVPFKCALCLPHPRTFTRESAITYSVTFATDPPSRSLARDIAAEATITVSFARQLLFDPSRGIRTSYSTAPTSSAATATSATTESSARSGSSWFGLKRTATTPSARSEANGAPRMLEKPLPAPPPEATTSEAKVLKSTVAHGFTRQRSKGSKHAKESSGGSASGPGILFQPDGIYKGKMDLSSEALPTITYGGANVKYVMTASVRFGSDELRVVADIKLVEPVARWERGESIRHGGTPSYP
ncbi:hypothetical protein AURDEDRAFT_187120 [Auricularia subglabra TFB-10046 SS5]|uniref:Uncharacterized protein n=1 Tax=Auricularia subglabra (strain TFB-10046 / SS5) TaxID=717982 RepID=J0D231_AURST|nr:hypothetical protein AURDEDRAFT_187120 [Auricularia subglabra TFB-10046 SS5]